jgi:predicted TPR repeat methyltransferase
MPQETQAQSFADGFAVGELTGRLKYQAPQQFKEWITLAKLQDFRGVLQKYNYSITGVTIHPSDSEQILIVAEKTAEGTNPHLIQAFGKGDRFMDGWATGCLVGLLRYTQPECIEEWVKVENLDAIQQVVDECGYEIKTMKLHPEKKQWIALVAQKRGSDRTV